MLDPIMLDPDISTLTIRPSHLLLISLHTHLKMFLENSDDDDTHRFNVSVKKSSFMDGFDRPQDLETKS